MSRPTDVIDAHIPSLTVADEDVILAAITSMGYEDEFTAGDLAVRTCACGVSIDGFYDYAHHLNVELLKAGF